MSVESFFVFKDTATTVIYTLSLHDALPSSTEAEVKSYIEGLDTDHNDVIDYYEFDFLFVC